jgi:hypothetical protein
MPGKFPPINNYYSNHFVDRYRFIMPPATTNVKEHNEFSKTIHLLRLVTDINHNEVRLGSKALGSHVPDVINAVVAILVLHHEVLAVTYSSATDLRGLVSEVAREPPVERVQSGDWDNMDEGDDQNHNVSTLILLELTRLKVLRLRKVLNTPQPDAAHAGQHFPTLNQMIRHRAFTTVNLVTKCSGMRSQGMFRLS